MSLTVNLEPRKTVHGLSSDVVAALAQLPYKFAREDYQINSLGAGSGFWTITLPGAAGDVTAEFTSGDGIYVNSDTYGEFSGVVTSSSWDGFNTSITTNIDSPGTTGLGYINALSRTNYAIECYIYDSAGSSLLMDEAIYFTTPSNGLVFFDLKAIIKSYLEANNLQEISYVLKYRESYTGLTPPSLTALADVQAIRATKQLLKDGGSNLWETLLRIGTDSRFPHISKFHAFGSSIFDFKGNYWEATGLEQFINSGLVRAAFNVDDAIYEPTYTITYMAEVGTGGIGTITGKVYYDSSAVLTVNFVADGTIRTIDVTATSGLFTGDFVGVGTLIGGTEGSDITLRIYDIEISKDQYLGKFLTKFKNPFYFDGWKRTVSQIIDDSFNSRTGYTDQLIRFQATDTNKVFLGFGTNTGTLGITPAIQEVDIEKPDNSAKLIKVETRNGSNTNSISEALYYLVCQECRNPIMVEWLNSLGAYDQHLFEINQEFTDNVEENEVYQLPINDDISNVSNVISKKRASNTQIINIIAENLTIDQLKALHEIKQSDDVRLFLSKDGSSYVNVVVDSNLETVYESDDSVFEYSLSIRLPENFDFYEAKLY